MVESKMVPQLRFKGFTDDWEQRKLGDEAIEMVAGGDIDKSLLDEYGRYPVIANALTDDGIVGYYAKEYRIKAPAVTVTGRGDVGHAKARTVDFTPVVRLLSVRSRHDVFFLENAINTLNIIIESTGVPQLTVPQLSQYEIFFPPTVDEEIAIGAFFGRIDNLITLHQRKYDKLLALKKSMLEKMFPKAGSDVPEIRFAGFAGDWEQRKFGELYEQVTQKNDLTYGIDRNITVATMQFKSDIRVTEEDYLRTYNVFLLGDIAFEGHQSKEFRYGRFVENDIGNGIVSHIFAVFRPKTKYDLQFWKYAINNERLMQPVLSRCTKASTMMNDLVATDFLAETFLVPCVEEQQLIGAFISKLDNLITLHQRKYDKLKQLKQSMLEKMFV